MAREGTSVSPSTEEQENDVERSSDLNGSAGIRIEGNHQAGGPRTSPSLPQDERIEAPAPPLPVNGSGSTRGKQDNAPANTRELEQMKVKYKMMERKRMEDRDKLRALDSLKIDRDKFESTMHKLQRKCQAQSQEIADWRRQLQEAEARVEEVEKVDAERGSEIENVTLDKEMAEERLDAASAELEILKDRCEELELEAEIIREENKELTSGMTSEERSSAGWLQMENENRRLREALLALRDTTQETEANLKSHVKELQGDLAGFEALKVEYAQTKSDLAASRTAVRTLKDNLEAADDQELLVAQLTEEKDTLTEQMSLLSAEVMDLKGEVAAGREIQEAQDETEKLLQENIDDVRAFAVERDQKTKDQARVIDNLEYTLLRFKEVVDGLQSDLEQLRANKQVNEIETTELNVKTRAMMDLNLRLQNAAAKTQTKKLESELSQVNAEDTALHLEILQSFVPESFKEEKGPILALLGFKRVTSKANMLRDSVQENMDHPPDNAQVDSCAAVEMIEKLQWISSCCSRLYSFMKGCTVEDFQRFNAALYELEPVERALDKCIDAVKRNDINIGRCTEDLQRMIAVLADLEEKTIPASPETFADIVTGRSDMMQLYSQVVGLELGSIKDSVRNKFGPGDEDEDLSRFNQEIQKLIDRSRTSRVVAQKVLRVVDEHRNRSMTLGETFMTAFELAESMGKDLAAFSRFVGRDLRDRLTEGTVGGESVKFDDITEIMEKSGREWLKQSSSETPEVTRVLEIVGEILSEFHSKLEGLLVIASDLSNFSEFERHPAPWTLRAKALKEQKVVDVQMEECVQQLQSQANEHHIVMRAKNTTIEEQSLKIELLEARRKGVKDHAEALQKLEKELGAVVAERESSVSELAELRREKQTLSQMHDEAIAKLATLNHSTGAGHPGATAALASTDGARTQQLVLEIEMLKEEITHLQSAVRFLKSENHRLLFPVTPTLLAATNHAWLEANPLPKPGRVTDERGAALAAEAKDVFSGLLEIASTMKPLQLQSPSDINATGRQSSWRPIKKTPRYIVAQQREELERWAEWRDDLVQRAVHGQRRKFATRTGFPQTTAKAPGTPPRGLVGDRVEIVGSPP